MKIAPGKSCYQLNHINNKLAVIDFYRLNS